MILNKEIDSIGATTNASTSKNFTCYYLKLPSVNVEQGIKILKEMVFHSILDSRELEKEKEVVLEEMNKSFDDSQDLIEDLLPFYLFKDSPLSHFIIGKKEIIKNIKRADLLKFYKKHYTPENSILVISGNFHNNLEKRLPKLINFNSNKKQILHNYDLYCIKKEMKIISKYREHSQITLGIAFPIFNYFDKRKYCLDILVSYLDGHLTSKLWVELREKNPLVYDADASYELFEEGGIFEFVYSLDKKNVFKSINIIKNIMEDIKDGKIKEEEFKLFQKNLILHLDIEQENSSEICHFFGEQLLLSDKINDFNDVAKEYANCTLEDIIELAKYIFDYQKMIVVQLGDINKKTFESRVKKIFN